MANLQGGEITSVQQVLGIQEMDAKDNVQLITVKDYDAAGNMTEIVCPMPEAGTFEQWTFRQQVVMLKRGMWRQCAIADIIWGMAQAKSLGADPMRGELFPTGDGRWGTSNKFKIKQALGTGKVVGIEVEMKDTGDPVQLQGCIQKTDLECTVQVHVKGWMVPIVRKARLSRWYKPKNPNWAGNPEHMLELNTVAHACEYVVPTATEDDEAPPFLRDMDLSNTAK